MCPMEPLLSFIVTTYNLPAPQLHRCLQSLLCQGLQPDEYEVVVADDGSTDSPQPVVDTILDASPDVSVRLLLLPHRRQGAARNAALAVATGRYVRFVDGDDWLPAGTAAPIVQQMEHHALDVLLFRHKDCQEGAEEANPQPLPKEGKKVTEDNNCQLTTGSAYMRRHTLFGSCCTLCFRRTLACGEQPIRFAEDTYIEDEDFVTRLVWSASRVADTPLVAYAYVRHAGSTTTGRSREHVDELFRNRFAALDRLRAFCDSCQGPRDGLVRKVRWFALDILRLALREPDASQRFANCARQLRARDLYPLRGHYGIKYNAFALLSRFPLGRRLLRYREQKELGKTLGTETVNCQLSIVNSPLPRILLVGEYSNVNGTLTRALRTEGYDVRMVSDGDDWKGYRQDVCLRRAPGPLGTLRYLLRLGREMLRWRGYDLVVINNPVHFVSLRARRSRRVYDYLRRHNRAVVLEAIGDDYCYIRRSYEDRPLRYSDFYTPTHEVDHDWNRANIQGWLRDAERVDCCRHVADTCHAIVAGLYEYYEAYHHYYPDKTHFMPLPIEEGGAYPQPLPQGGEPVSEDNNCQLSIVNCQFSPLRLFVGIQRLRSQLKGTDILLRVARELEQRYPQRVEVVVAENLPFTEYLRLMRSCHVLLDQIYSYTPAMNALQAMAMGLVVVSGGEPEAYEQLETLFPSDGERLRPVVNVLPDEDSVRATLEDLVLHPDRLPELSRQGQLFVRHYHSATLSAHCLLHAAGIGE